MIFEEKRTGRRAEVSFRPFQEGDEASFLTCIEDFYGGGYPYKEYWKPGFLLEKCREGTMSVICGVTSSGEIISTSAVRFDTKFSGSGLLLLRVVKNAYQGMGIGTKQEQLLFQTIQNRPGLTSLYSDVITHNTVGQRNLASQHFVLCGIRPMLYRAEIMLPYGLWPAGTRLSQAVMCRREGGVNAGTIYCPKEHREAVRRIYRELGAECRMVSDFSSQEMWQTQLEYTIDTLHHTSVEIIYQAGKDFSSWLSGFQAGKEKVALCYLNLKNAGAPSAYAALRQAGFFFTGMKPLNRDGEYMLMARMRPDLFWNHRVQVHPEGGWLLEYIREHCG